LQRVAPHIRGEMLDTAWPLEIVVGRKLRWAAWRGRLGRLGFVPRLGWIGRLRDVDGGRLAGSPRLQRRIGEHGRCWFGHSDVWIARSTRDETCGVTVAVTQPAARRATLKRRAGPAQQPVLPKGRGREDASELPRSRTCVRTVRDARRAGSPWVWRLSTSSQRTTATALTKGRSVTRTSISTTARPLGSVAAHLLTKRSASLRRMKTSTASPSGWSGLEQPRVFGSCNSLERGVFAFPEMEILFSD
jgi:hypothetical protein